MAVERYNAREAEPRWQKAWEERGIFATSNDDPRPKYYVLEMFPYPSGRIHMGHVRNYAMGDVVARFKRATGFNVLHPMGWDAFGMPAENAAMERKVHPKAWTYQNIAAMKAQLKSMGLSLDWRREIATCEPNYYKHQQEMFLDFLRAGLVERKLGKVNWDPVDQTVLANEQVIDGRGWRSDALVVQREMPQWYFVITQIFGRSAGVARSARSLAGEGAPHAAQLDRPLRGAAVRFALDPATTPNREDELEVFTTRHDTLFGAKFMALSPDHPLATAAAAKRSGARGIHRRMQTPRHRAAADRHCGKERVRHRDAGAASLRSELEASGLCRELHADGLRHRRDLRLPGARSARSGFRRTNTAGKHAGGLPARSGPRRAS